MRTEQKVIPYLDMCRWLAAVSVVLCHTLTAVARQYEHYGMPIHDSYLYMSFSKVTDWAVPAFLMISGILYMNPNRSLSYRVVITKYVRRIFLALAVFGLPMCAIEQLLGQGIHDGIGPFAFQTVINWAAGKCWDHMWYLYMLLGLLFIVPILKEFLNHSTKNELRIFIAVLFFFNSVVDTLRFIGIEIGIRFPIDSIYPLYMILGYYIEYCADPKYFRRGLWGLCTICSGAVVFMVQFLIPEIEVKYASPLLVCYAVSVFCLLKSLNKDSAVLAKTRYLCFAVYLIHPFFINVSYKILGITPVQLGLYTTPVLFAVVFLVLTIIAAYILGKIPFMRKYIF